MLLLLTLTKTTLLVLWVLIVRKEFSNTIRSLTEPGDHVVFLTPAYNCFFSCVKQAGRVCSESPVIYTNEGGVLKVSIDWEDLERRCAHPSAKMLLLCNPHNPLGRVWTPGELARLGVLAREHGLVVLSDEIHCELEMPGRRFMPFAVVSAENETCSVTMNSPSKSFNTASLQIANIISPDPVLRARIARVLHSFELNSVGPFGVEALQAAYNQGEGWLKELNEYLWSNYCLLRALFARELPECPVTELQATYLAWVDVSAIGKGSEDIVNSLMEHEHVRPGPGAWYGDDRFLRINLACPRILCEEGLKRIVSGLKRLKNE